MVISKYWSLKDETSVCSFDVWQALFLVSDRVEKQFDKMPKCPKCTKEVYFGKFM